MRVLMVTKFLPYPANQGGKLRSLAILQRYLSRGDEVVLVAHDDGTADHAGLARLGVRVLSVPWTGGPRRLIRGIVKGKSAILGRFYTPELFQAAARLAQRQHFDVLQIEYLHNCVYADVLHAAPGAQQTIRVLDLHDVASAQARKIAAVAQLPLKVAYLGEGLALARRERAVLAEYDVLACVSEHDAAMLGADRFLVAPNGWTPTARLGPPDGDNVVFVGNFAFSTNVDAAVWFSHSIWPKILDRVPSARLQIVGKDPAPAVRALDGRHGVHVTGTVPDVTPYLERSRVAIAPLRAGSGSRLKILEALEAARPVVSTRAGLEGLERFSGRGVVVADEPDSFSTSVCELLRAPARAAALGELGREAVHEAFLWQNTLSPMFDAIDLAVEARSLRRPA